MGQWSRIARIRGNYKWMALVRVGGDFGLVNRLSSGGVNNIKSRDLVKEPHDTGHS